MTPCSSQFFAGTRFGASGSSLESDSDEKNSDSNVLERQRTFSELSRPSFSSLSPSSSFSSIDYNRATQYEPTSFDRITFPDSPSMEAEMSLKSSSPQFSRRNLDLRDFVKDSMYREVQGLSSKTKTKEAVGDPAMKYRDSPRLQSQIRDGSHASYLDTRQRIHADLNESVRVLAELQDAPWYHNEPRGLMRSSSYHAKETSRSISRDAPRFSCDGREVNRGPFDSLDIRSGPKWSTSTDCDSNLFSRSLEKVRDESRGKAQSVHCTPGRQARPPSVVAKLMGLEMLPNCVSSSNTNTSSGWSYPEKDFAKLSRSSAKADPSLNQSNSSKNFRKDPCSPRWRNPDSSVKPVPRVPIEPAPWKLTDSSKSKQKPGSKITKARAKVPSTFPSVYSEIEERLKDLEFTRSGRDLRALKQILEAMQSKGFLGTEKGGPGQQNLHSSKHEGRSGSNPMQQIDQVLESIKRTGFSQNYESPIVIMKPANLLGKSGIPATSVISFDVLSGLPKHWNGEVQENWNGIGSGRAGKDLSPKSSQQHNTVNYANAKADRTLKSTQASTRSQHLVKDGNAGSRKSSESISPRLRQKKLELERRSRPPTPPDSVKSRRQPNKQEQRECTSPGSRRRLKYPCLPQSNDQQSEFNVVSKNLNHRETDNSVQSNESIVWSSKNVVAFGFERSPGISSFQNQSIKSSESVISGSEGKISTLVQSEEEPTDLGVVQLEYSSPISVLDNVECKDNSPSPIKNIGTTLEVDMESSLADRFVSNSMGFDSPSEINQIKLQNIDNLVRKLRRVNSSHDEVHTNYTASLCENTDPDHRYISEILLASGFLLRELGSNIASFQFHSYNHPINPGLFLVLEQSKARSTFSSTQGCLERNSQLDIKEKLHRKLVFETVNEILARKLASAGPCACPLLRSVTLSRRVLNAQKLLRELFSEIEEIRAKTHKCSPDEEDSRWKNILCKDVMHQSQSWEEFDDGYSGAVLDIERLIFKDLVSEIVNGESAGLNARPGRRRLHAK